MIKNFDKLAVSDERKKLLEILDYGLEMVRSEKIIEDSIVLKGDLLYINNQPFDLSEFEKIYVLGIGKASARACEALERILENRIYAGYCIDVMPAKLNVVTLTQGTHKEMAKKNFSFTNAVVSVLGNLTQKDLVISIICGGGSALFCYPYQSEVITGKSLFERLTKKGATIKEINTIRKHLSLVKGGGLAKIIYPATLIGLIFSDVPGDDLNFVASGPTVKDKTTIVDAQNILDKYNIDEKVEFIETPKQDKYFKRVYNYLVCSNKIALEVMEQKARSMNLKARIWKNDFESDANEAAKLLLQEAKTGELLLVGGETTVKIKGNGLGGRNQQVALSALQFIKEEEILISCASDGYDNSDASGAIADKYTLQKAKNLGLNIKSYLDNNDSFNFFAKTGDQIITGLTGINISDLFLIFKK